MRNNSTIHKSSHRSWEDARDWLIPRLRQTGGLSECRLPESPYFRATVRAAERLPFATRLSETVSLEVMRKVESATAWLRTQIRRVSGHNRAFTEPIVVQNLSSAGTQVFQLVKISEALVNEIDEAPTAKECRDRLPGHGSNALPFDREATREAKEWNLISTVIHEYVHAARGVQVGRNSLDIVRLGVRVNAFNVQPTSKAFLSFTEAAAVLTESRFLTEQGLAPEPDWFVSYFDIEADESPEMLAWKKMQALEAIKIPHSSDLSSTTMRDRFMALLKEVEVAVRRTQAQGHEVMLELTGYGNSEPLVVVGYAHFQWGMEHLAREIFRGRSNGDQDSVRMLQELLLTSEVLAEPRPVFREILNLAKKDAKHAAAPTALNERLLWKRYLEFFAYLRPKDPFDGMVFQAFVKADQFIPKERLAQYRSELLNIYKHATKDC